jgi:hypothetical protein
MNIRATRENTFSKEILQLFSPEDQQKQGVDYQAGY